jgi:membrane associated rhomboid family serine protease
VAVPAGRYHRGVDGPGRAGPQGAPDREPGHLTGPPTDRGPGHPTGPSREREPGHLTDPPTERGPAPTPHPTSQEQLGRLAHPSSEDEVGGRARRTSGLTLDACYRHPRELTGVHCTRCGRPICPDCMHPAPVGHQCPDCVAQARRGLRRASITLGGASLTRVLIAANVAVFLLAVVVSRVGAVTGRLGGLGLFRLGAMNPLAVAEGQYWRLFTAMFLHAGLLHLLLNMYGLWLFGSVIERALGTWRFAGIYLASGVLASVTSLLFADPRSVSVGASGAIFGLLGAWVAYNFRRRSSPLASANLRTAALIVGLNLFLGFAVPGVDNLAHVGGLVAGAVAGSLAEGLGPRALRPLVQVAGFAALAAAAAALTAWRVAALG